MVITSIGQLIKVIWLKIFSSIQSLSRVQLFATPWTTAHQASLSITNSRSLLKLMSIGEKAASPHSSTLAWKIPWMEEPGGLQSKRSHKVGRDWSNLAAAACPLSQWCHPAISSSVIPFSSRLQSCPALGSFPVSQLFTSVAKVLEFQLQHQSFQWIFHIIRTNSNACLFMTNIPSFICTTT